MWGWNDLGTGILDLHGMDITILIGEDTMGLVGATTTHRTMDGMVEDTITIHTTITTEVTMWPTIQEDEAAIQL